MQCKAQLCDRDVVRVAASLRPTPSHQPLLIVLPTVAHPSCSYLLVAKHDNYIVACATEEAVAACRRLRLPCYDARDIVEVSVWAGGVAQERLGRAGGPSS